MHDVHDDLSLLADYEIIHVAEHGRSKQPSVPSDTVRIEVEFGSPRGDRSESPASAYPRIPASYREVSDVSTGHD